MSTLDGRRALVTGGTRGLGLAVVKELLALGAEVVFTGTTETGVDAAVDRLGGRARGVVADMRNREAMRGLGAEGWDILVNNASLGGPLGPLHETDESVWEDAIDVDLLSVAALCRAVLPGMTERGGMILNISTGAAHRPIPGSSAYCVAKAGLAMLTRVLDAEYGALGVRVTGFSPGVMRTDMHLNVRAYYEGVFAPLDEVEGPETAAKLAAWLCTEAAVRFAGQEVSVLDEEVRAAAGVFAE